MALIKMFFGNALLILCMLVSATCSATNRNTEINLVGSSPGDEAVKDMLNIKAEVKIDFIRWNLIFSDKNSFVLDINYGESQPNTLGFIGGGEKKTFKGTFSISKNNDFKEVYQLKSVGFFKEIQIAKLNENLFHLLSSQHQLMVGNGGWSYSLNRKESIQNNEISWFSKPADYKSLQVIYEGRTPCQEISNEHPEAKVTSSCFKIKWRLILNRDPLTHQPTTCAVRNIADNQPRDISGTWEIIKGIATNPEAIIYKIKVVNLTEPILLLAADDHVLFFLDKYKKPFIGNKDFSYTMNKRINN